MKKIAILFQVFFVYSCETPKGFPGISEDISDAKKRGVFIQEYTVYPNPYRINDTLQITIKEAWLEKQWIHTSTKDGTKFRGYGYQIAINTTEKDLVGCDFSWKIGIDTNKYLHLSSPNSLAGDFTLIPGDTITYPVHTQISIFDTLKHEREIIGRFILIKKGNG